MRSTTLHLTSSPFIVCHIPQQILNHEDPLCSTLLVDRVFRVESNHSTKSVPGFGCLELKNAVSSDIKFYKRLDWAMEIVKKLNRSDEETGRPGYSYIFESFFDGVAPEGQLIFSPSKLLKIRTMLPLLKDLESVENLELLMKMLRSVTKDKYRIREQKKLFDSLQDDDKVLEILNEKF
ncbi:hypothetical protein B9Z55_009135 [Caenorhabditis nigoni]|uniref:Uncharacterized protein n=1 Tax=Caenorhabditis nigoni TaxID=1611254 RepID=A0A2G5UQY8_9PELO|nr:hypothetical protein B9Z55_009135 [Caenorhabditis nigoni]